jgi:site-specific DNA recombinase
MRGNNMSKISTASHNLCVEGQPQIVKPKRAAIYIRCSSDEAKKEGYSPETQREKVQQNINENGWQIDKNHIYSDIGFSGSTDKRPGLQQLLQDARNKEFDVIVVYRMDRFFRNLRLLLNTVGELRDLGIEFKSVTEPFDTSTPTGRAMFANVGVFAEWMREIGLESRDEGMIKAMKAGKWLGGTPPYGYKFNKTTQKLEIDKEEAPVIKMIYKWQVDDKLSEYKIQKKINSMGIPTKLDRLGRRKKTESKNWWNRRTIGRILRNEIYTGTFYYRKQKHPARVKSENDLRPKEEWIKVEDKNLQIISPKIFEKAQQQLIKNKELSPRNTKQVYVLQHKIICGLDGYHYQCATRHYRSKKTGDSRETKYYFCTGNRSYFSPIKCPAPTISESRILPPVWDKLKEILTDPEVIMQELEDYLEQKGKKNKIQQKLNSIENALNSFKIKRERYAELYAEGSITKDFYDKKIQECDKEIQRLQKENEKFFYLLLTEKERQKRIKSLKELHLQLKENLESATYEMKMEILQRLVEKIVKTDNKLDIEFNIPFDEGYPKPNSVYLMDNRRVDCRHNSTKTFRIFVTTYILPREEIHKRANINQNFLNKNGTPKAKSRHKVEEDIH